MKKTSFRLCTLIILFMFFSLNMSFATKVYYDDFQLKIDTNSSYLSDGDVYVPFVDLFESLGASIQLLDDVKTYQAELKNGVLQINSDEILFNGQGFKKTVNVQKKDNVLYIPLKNLLVQLDFSVGYDTEKQAMRISREERFALTENGEIIPIENVDLKNQSIVLDYVSTDMARLHLHYDMTNMSAYRMEVMTSNGHVIYAQAVSQNRVLLSNLTDDTIYTARLYKNDELVFQKGFSTFSERLISNQIYYEITPWDFEKGLIKLDVFLYNNNNRTMTIKENPDKLPLGAANISYDKINVSDVKHKISPDDYRIDFDLEAKKTAKISYIVDKSYDVRSVDSWHGTLTPHFLSVMFNQVTFIVDEDINNLIVNINLPLNWASALGVKETPIENLYKEIPDDDYDLSHTNIYAYHKELFNLTERQIGPTKLKIIVDRMYDTDISETILSLYLEQIQLWGGYPYEDTYSVLIFNGQDGMKTQGPKGQSWSYHDEWFYSIAYQMFSKWNGWEKGIQLGNDGVFAFWYPGINVYYQYKLANHLGLQDDTYGEIAKFYDLYMNEYYWTKKDIAILDLSDRESEFLLNKKTALYVYLLDQEIQNKTNGEKSLDDVLKLAWKARVEDNIEMTEAHFKMYVEEIVGTSMNDWWDAHMFYKRKLNVPEFETSHLNGLVSLSYRLIIKVVHV